MFSGEELLFNFYNPTKEGIAQQDNYRLELKKGCFLRITSLDGKTDVSFKRDFYDIVDGFRGYTPCVKIWGRVGDTAISKKCSLLVNNSGYISELGVLDRFVAVVLHQLVTPHTGTSLESFFQEVVLPRLFGLRINLYMEHTSRCGEGDFFDHNIPLPKFGDINNLTGELKNDSSWFDTDYISYQIFSASFGLITPVTSEVNDRLVGADAYLLPNGSVLRLLNKPTRYVFDVSGQYNVQGTAFFSDREELESSWAVGEDDLN